MMSNQNRIAFFQNCSSTTSSSSTMLIMNVEDALGLKPKMKGGVWLRDNKMNPQYVVSNSRKNTFIGANPMGEKGCIAREMLFSAAMANARASLEAVFIRSDSNKACVHSLDLLALRLRAARPIEDANSIVLAFINTVSQQDVLDKERDFNTVDRESRKHQMRKNRALEKVAKAELKGETLSFEDALDMCTPTTYAEPENLSHQDDVTAFTSHGLVADEVMELSSPNVDSVPDVETYDEPVNLLADAEDDFPTDSDYELDEDDNLQRLAANNAMKGMPAPEHLDFDEFGVF